MLDSPQQSRILKKGSDWMLRDIDYAAAAVKKAILEKFDRKSDLQRLEVSANERTISVRDGENHLEGTRDELLAVVRASESYDSLWTAP